MDQSLKYGGKLMHQKMTKQGHVQQFNHRNQPMANTNQDLQLQQMYASDGSSTVFNASLGFQAQGTADFSNNSDTGYLSTGQANLNSSSQMQSYYE